MIKQLVLILFLLNWNTDIPMITESGVLQIKIGNIKKGTGKIRLAIYNSTDYFLGDQLVLGVNEMVNKAGEQLIEIPDLPYGEYAISLYHDQNDNGKLDANFFKIPKEPYAFSNNARGRFGPPSYEEARFVFAKSSEVIEVKLH